MIKITRETNEIEKEVDRIAAGPTLADYAKFEEVLASQFQLTQFGVHVITGSLKLSGKIHSNVTNSKWEGEITYGGPSAGIHNPVDYAEYERNRDGDHDFLQYVAALSGDYIQAIKEFMEG